MDKCYTFCGYDYGTFRTRDTNEERKYCNIYVISPLEGGSGRYCDGYRAEKFSCTGPEVFKDVEPHDVVTLTFNRYGRVIGIEVVEKKSEKK